MDVIEGGPDRSRPRRVSRVAWAVVLAAAAAYVAVRSTGADRPGQPAAPAVASASTGAAQLPTPSAEPPPVAGACGNVAHRPVASLQPLTVRTGARLLVGGYGLRVLDADTGTARAAAGMPASARQQVTKLVSARKRVYALSTACDGSAGRIYRVDGGTARPIAGPPSVDLISGASRVWAVEQPDPATDPAAPLVLRLLESARSLHLPARTYPLADSDAGLVVAGTPPDPDNLPVRILVLDPTGVRPPRSLGSGHPLAAGRSDLMLLTGACDTGDAASCSITRVEIRTGRVVARHSLPKGRVPVSPGSLSSDGQRVAFQLAQPFVDTRPNPGHPGAPSDIAVLRLDDGRLDIVPGLQLAPKTGAGLVFGGKDGGPDSWLFVSVSHGNHSHVYAWRPGVPGPLRIARLTGPVAWAPPLFAG